MWIQLDESMNSELVIGAGQVLASCVMDPGLASDDRALSRRPDSKFSIHLIPLEPPPKVQIYFPPPRICELQVGSCDCSDDDSQSALSRRAAFLFDIDAQAGIDPLSDLA